EIKLNVGVEKLDTHDGVGVQALLDSGATGMFMDKAFAKEEGFKLEPLEKPIPVKNVDGTINASGAVTHRVAANVYYKGHKERVHFEICGLGKN
ncbi:hypothetical protein AGABI2DRAFT_51461, partial [Agaricus bisporus var. bisporus H97]|uniref:hypothetical protein n=1 Tax=Agaricus bisporus var. bisporus (strain H97 / ATCC MYA-4626 / FGSC 10389) TaxID=936046 RepID=UPI00029F65C3